MSLQFEQWWGSFRKHIDAPPVLEDAFYNLARCTWSDARRPLEMENAGLRANLAHLAQAHQSHPYGETCLERGSPGVSRLARAVVAQFWPQDDVGVRRCPRCSYGLWGHRELVNQIFCPDGFLFHAPEPYPALDATDG